MLAYYTPHTTDGRAAVVPVPAGQDRWLIAVRYVRAFFLGEVYLDDRLEWLAYDP